MHLPLYQNNQLLTTSVEQTEALNHTSACDRCTLHKRATKVCIQPEGQPGGLLIIGEGPGSDEDQAGRPFIGQSGRLLRSELRKHWNGPVAYTNSTNCYPAGLKVTDVHVDACRPYLAAVIQEVKPTRIICLGAWAVYGVLGHSVPIGSVRKGYTFLSDGTPVFIVVHPAAALRNKFVMQHFCSDLEWALTTEVDKPPADAQVRIVETEEDAADAIQQINSSPFAPAVDAEWAGRAFTPTHHVLCIGVGLPDGNAWVWTEAALANGAGKLLKAWLADPSIRKVGQAWKSDYVALKCAGIPTAGWDSDVRLLRKLLDPEARAGLAAMSFLVGMGGFKDEARDQATRRCAHLKGNITRQCKLPEWTPASVLAALELGDNVDDHKFALIEKPLLHRYNALDCVVTARLAVLFERQMQDEPELNRVWKEITHPASYKIGRMECNGVAASKLACRELRDHAEVHVKECEETFKKYELNPKSNPQKQKLLFETLGLPVFKLTDGGAPCTDKEVMQKLKGKHEIVDTFLAYSKYTKIFDENIEQYIRSDGRIHPRLLLDGARTGRLSSRDPNLQNRRRPKDIEGIMARNIFVAREGYKLLEVDLSQIELRIAAMLSGDPNMIQIFLDGVDYHRRTAELIAKDVWGIEPHEITDEHRTIAKTTNFAAAYGATAERVAEQITAAGHKCNEKQAQKIIDAITGAFGVYAQWKRDQERHAQQHGYVWTHFPVGVKARKRPLLKIVDRDDGKGASKARNGAGNTPVQGTANDYCLASYLKICDWIDEAGYTDVCLPVLTVHDSLLFEVREDLVEEVAKNVLRIMVSWPTLYNVPLAADVKVGVQWGEMKKLELAA